MMGPRVRGLRDCWEYKTLLILYLNDDRPVPTSPMLDSR